MKKTAFILIFMLFAANVAICGETKDPDREKEIVSVLEKLVKAEQKRIEALKKKNQEVKAPSADKTSEKDKDVKNKETFPGAKEPDEVKGKVDNQRVAFNAEEDDIERLVETIRNAAKVNIVMDQNAIADGVKRGTVRTSITLRVDNMTLQSALNWICRLAGLAWTLEDEAIFITTPDRIVTKNQKLKIYDIRDLSIKIQDFPGPSIELAPGDADINIFAPNN